MPGVPAAHAARTGPCSREGLGRAPPCPPSVVSAGLAGAGPLGTRVGLGPLGHSSRKGSPSCWGSGWSWQGAEARRQPCLWPPLPTRLPTAAARRPGVHGKHPARASSLAGTEPEPRSPAASLAAEPQGTRALDTHGGPSLEPLPRGLCPVGWPRLPPPHAIRRGAGRAPRPSSSPGKGSPALRPWVRKGPQWPGPQGTLPPLPGASVLAVWQTQALPPCYLCRKRGAGGRASAAQASAVLGTGPKAPDLRGSQASRGSCQGAGRRRLHARQGKG